MTTKNSSFHKNCLVLDSHTDTPSRLLQRPARLSEKLDTGHVDLPRLLQGGVDAVAFALYVPASYGIEDGAQRARTLLDLARRQLIPGALEEAHGVTAIREAKDRGVVAVFWGLENGRCLGQAGMLEELAREGIRYVTLTHVATHEWCDAAGDEPAHGGLADDGVKLVRQMNQLGVAVDVAHISDQAVEHVLEVSKTPIIASHSSARALCDHPRNLTDSLIREIAKAGGVIMANAYPAFLDKEACTANHQRLRLVLPEIAQLEKELHHDPQALYREIGLLFEPHPLPEVSIERYVDHILHLVNVAGEEHVGLGTDFDGITATPVGFEDASCFPHLTQRLLDRGLDPAAVRWILGESFLQAMSRIEQIADP